MGGVLQPDNCIRLRTFLALDDVKLDVIALFQCFVTVQLNRRVVNEDIRAIFTADESVALGVVEPLHFAFVLSHRLVPFLQFQCDCGERGNEGRGPPKLYDDQTAGKVDSNFPGSVHKVVQA